MYKEPFFINKNTFINLHKKSFKAQRLDQSEVCGLITVDQISNYIDLIYMENLSEKPGSFEISIHDILSEEALLIKKGFDVLGSFHSHPVSEAIPSDGDLKNTFYNGVELIHDVCGQECKLWLLEEGELSELSISLVS